MIDTSTIFSTATDEQIRDFAGTYEDLFDINNIDTFVSGSNRNARKYIASLIRSNVLQGIEVETLREASQETGLGIATRNGKIVMPAGSKEITELMRFLNDGRYRGPVSGDPYITNSRRPAP